MSQTSSQPVFYSYTARAFTFTPVPAYKPVTVQIKILGDSITAGGECTGYSPSGEEIIKGKKASETGYCYANLLKEHFKNDKVKNWGISGFTSADILKNISVLVEQEDDVVLLMIGVNDCRQNNIPIRFEANLEAIIKYITGKNKGLIIITCSPATRREFHHEKEVVNIQKQLAEKYDLQCIDVYQGFLDYCKKNKTKVNSLLTDKLHPNDAGQKVIYDIIIKNIDLSGYKKINPHSFSRWKCV